jgi:hypothetical protein
MAHKFWQLPIDTKFTIPGLSNEQYKKISDTRAVRRTYPSDEWETLQYPFRKDIEVFTLDVPPISTWEEFHIEIVHEPGGNEDERSEVTERFESELYRLVQKYQGQADLKFYARNSESEIVEW